ncbi:MAG: NrfD/PsrC family molybdoenzyme membrane anchor subunit [Bacteroidota bacterium]
MHELYSTRANPLIDPSLHVWGWEIAVYLFLGGLVAGIMIIGGYFMYRGRHTESICVCEQLPMLGLVLLSAGMIALFLDLEDKWHVWRFYLTFQIASPMSWGSWILLLVYPVLVLTLAIRPPRYLTQRFTALDRARNFLRGRSGLVRRIGMASMVLGAGLGIYTGILLSALGARPLWNSPLLGFIFLLSGLSSAAALVHLISRDPGESRMLARADNMFLTAESALILLFLIGLITTSRVHEEAAVLLLTGAFAPVFWVFVIALGIIIPLIIQSLAVAGKIRHVPASPVLVMAGGLALRFVIVAAGQASHWASTIH